MSRKASRKKRIQAAKGSPGSLPEIRAIGGTATISQPSVGDDGKVKLARFEGNAYTGAAMKPEGWPGPIIVDLDGLKIPNQHRPVLRQHDHTKIVGHTESVRVTDKGVQIAGAFSNEESPYAKEIATLAKHGFQWQLSIGANPLSTEHLEPGKTAMVNGREVTGPLTISRETELGEISFVPLGADGDTSATVSASKGRKFMFKKAALKLARQQGLKAALKYSEDEIDKMTEDDAKAALKQCMAADDSDKTESHHDTEDKTESDDDPDAKGTHDDADKDKKTEARIRQAIAAATKQGIEAARQMQAAEQARVNDIRARAARHGVTTIELEQNGKKGNVDLVSYAITAGWTADQAELHALRAARPGPGVGLPGGLAYSTTTPEINGPVLEAAVLHGLRHSFQLEDDSFYFDRAPDGSQIRRVPKRLQDEAQRDFKARYTDQVQQAAHTIFRGRITLHELIATGMRGMGFTGGMDLRSEGGITSALKAWDFLDKSNSIRAEGASNASISNILANVMNKFALQGYLFTEQAWREFCAVRSVNDFKATKSINLLGLTMFKKFGPAGELANFAIGDQAFANQADAYGGIVTIPWTHLVNDDLGILGQVPMKVGQGAGLALNDAIYTLLAAMAAGTTNGDDGVAFFRTTSLVTDAAKKNGKAYQPNKTSGGGSALSSAALKTAKALFDNQIDPNGNPLGFDGAMPVLLFGPSNWVTAIELITYRELVYGGASASKQPQGNVWAGTMKPVMSRYIENAAYLNSPTAFFVMYNPAALAVIEAAFLNGVDTPSVLQAGPDFQFDKPGISIRGTMPFGANAQNFRGGVFSVGA